MPSSLHIVVCGYSIYMDSIVASLEQTGDVIITRLHARRGVLLRIMALAPNVVILDDQIHSNELIAALLHRDFPVLLLDAQQNSITKFSKQRITILNATDLIKVVEQVALQT